MLVLVFLDGNAWKIRNLQYITSPAAVGVRVKLNDNVFLFFWLFIYRVIHL